MDLTKMFVLVPASSSATVESIVTKSSSTNKVYFMEGYNQIVAKGTVYGVDPSTGNELETLVNVLGGTKAADGTVSVDFSGLNYTDNTTIIGTIRALDAKINTEMGKLADSKTLDANYEFTGKLVYVPAVTTPEGAVTKAAHIALVDKDGNELAESSVDVSNIIGNSILKSSVYDKDSGKLTLVFDNGAGGTQPIEVDLAAMLDINDVNVADGSANYIEVDLTGGENSQAVFSIKVSKMADATLTGLADAKDVKDYVDAQVAAKNVSAEGDGKYITATAADNKVSVSANIASITYTPADGSNAAKLEGTANKLSDSAATATAVKGYVDATIAKEVLDRNSAIQTKIEGLDVPEATVGAGNVQVTYSETDGKVAISSVAEKYATVTRTETTSAAGTPAADAAISISSADEGKLIKASDLKAVAAYAADLKAEEAHRVDKKIADLAVSAAGDDYITAEQDSTNNKKINVSANVKNLIVTTAEGVDSTLAGTANSLVDGDDVATKVSSFVNARISEEIKKLDVTEETIGDSNVVIKYSETDGKVAASADIKYATVTYGKVGDSAATFTVSDGTQLAKGEHIAELRKYVDSHVAEAVAGLDSSITKNDASNFVTVTTAIADGALSADASSVAVTYASHTAANAETKTPSQYSDGIATSAFVNEVLGDLWETYVDA